MKPAGGPKYSPHLYFVKIISASTETFIKVLGLGQF